MERKRQISLKKLVDRTDEIRGAAITSVDTTNKVLQPFQAGVRVPTVDQPLIIKFGDYLNDYIMQALEISTVTSAMATADSIENRAKLRASFITALESNEGGKRRGGFWGQEKNAYQRGLVVGLDPLFNEAYLESLRNLHDLATYLEAQYLGSAASQKGVLNGLSTLARKYGQYASGARKAGHEAEQHRAALDGLLNQLGPTFNRVNFEEDPENDKLLQKISKAANDEARARNKKGDLKDKARSAGQAFEPVGRGALAISAGREAQRDLVSMANSGFIYAIGGWEASLIVGIQAITGEASDAFAKFTLDAQARRKATMDQIKQLRASVRKMEDTVDGK